MNAYVPNISIYIPCATIGSDLETRYYFINRLLQLLVATFEEPEVKSSQFTGPGRLSLPMAHFSMRCAYSKD